MHREYLVPDKYYGKETRALCIKVGRNMVVQQSGAMSDIIYLVLIIVQYFVISFLFVCVCVFLSFCISFGRIFVYFFYCFSHLFVISVLNMKWWTSECKEAMHELELIVVESDSKREWTLGSLCVCLQHNAIDEKSFSMNFVSCCFFFIGMWMKWIYWIW